MPDTNELHLRLLEQNQAWAEKLKREHPDLLQRLAKQQTPKILWIGCADSRVPPNEITGTEAGDLFMHRNIANMIVHTDMNMLSVLDYAVNVLKVEHVIICGHTRCGGVQTALKSDGEGIADIWVRHIRDVARVHREQLETIPHVDERLTTLIKLNVAEQVYALARTEIIRKAWKEPGRNVRIHGWLYHLETGLIEDLHLDRDANTPNAEPELSDLVTSS